MMKYLNFRLSLLLVLGMDLSFCSWARIISVMLCIVIPSCNVKGMSESAAFQSNASAETVQNPKLLDYDYYMQLPTTPDTAWHFSNRSYAESQKGGKTQIRIYLTQNDDISKAPSVSVQIEDLYAIHQQIEVATIDENRCYTFDIDLPHPQFVRTNSFGFIYVAPEDTLEVFTTLGMSQDAHFRTFRSRGESAVINTLMPHFLKKYGQMRYNYDEVTAIIKQGKDATQQMLELWADEMNEIIADEKLRQALIHSPLSSYGKDLVMVSIVANKCTEIENLIMNYRCSKPQMEKVRVQQEKKTNYVPLDLQSIYAKMLQNKALIYDNPLVISERAQWAFVNHTSGGPLFYDILEGNNLYSRNHDKYGMFGTFMSDWSLSRHLLSQMESLGQDIKFDRLTEDREKRLKQQEEAVAEVLANVHDERIIQAITNQYSNFLNSIDSNPTPKIEGWTAQQYDLWNKIVSPYKGNMLFLDFWDTSCGPCRSGMIKQKKLVEELSSEAIRFIYIAQEHRKGKCEKWMTENNIKGEHIYITAHEWVLFESMIGFSGIPRGVLVSKDGLLIEKDFHIELFSKNELKRLFEK